MIRFIITYYLFGILLIIGSGVLCAIIYKGVLTSDEEREIIDNIVSRFTIIRKNKVSLIILDIISIMTMPIIAMVLDGLLFVECDRLVHEKELS